MRHFRFLFIIFALLLPGARALAQSAAPLPNAPSPAPAFQRRAVEWFARMQMAMPDRAQLTPTLNSRLTTAEVQSMSTELKPLGRPYTISYLGGRIVGGNDVYAYLLDFHKAVKLREIIAVDDSGKIAGLVFTMVK